MLVIIIFAYFALSVTQTTLENDKTASIVCQTIHELNEGKNEEDNTDFNKSWSDGLERISIISYAKEMCAIAFSIILSSFATLFIVEKRNKNDIYSIAIEDFLDTTNCKIDLSDLDNTKFSVSKTLSEYKLPNGMIDEVIKKIGGSSLTHYYESCSITVNCYIRNDYIEKVITKTIYLKSYQDIYEFKKETNPFVLVEFESPDFEPLSRKKALSIQEVIIEKEVTSSPLIKTKEIKTSHRDLNDALNKKKNYIKNHKAILKQSLEISNKYQTKLSYTYKTKVPISDKSFVFRLPCACKKFSLSFILNDDSDIYRLFGEAYGFCEDGQIANDDNRKQINFEFEDWAFDKDGVAIFILDQ